MGKNDFDIDFDFEKEYGFNPQDLGDTEPADKDMDLDALLGGEDAPAQEADGFDLDVDLDEFLSVDDQEAGQPEIPDFIGANHAEYAGEPEYREEYASEPEQDGEYDDMQFEEPPPQEPYDPFAPEEDPEEPRKKPFFQRKPREPKPKRTAQPTIFTKFYDLYFAPVLDKSMREEPVDPNNPRRRRRKSQMQVFKEVFLPPVAVCLTAILLLTFVIGSVTNAIRQHQIDLDAEKSQLSASESEAAALEEKQRRILAEAEALAVQYDYAGAIEVINSIGDLTAYPELQTRRGEYVTAQSQLIEHPDPSLIPNLSFHCLVVDMARAKLNPELGGKYNQNFVTTDEFAKILTQLYNNGYVLVDLDSFAPRNGDLIVKQSIFLPPGKSPIMLTETLVNYFEYMVDGNDDGKADATGDGFANKLVLDANGEIKANYIDASGNELTGDYDLVPILETFIKAHPDFVYKGARATLAVTGGEGIFGYRINTSYYANEGKDFYETEVAGARVIVQALRDKGYTLACNTFGNKKYGEMNAKTIGEDLSNWTKDITPVIGDVDVFVFAQESFISDYSGNSFTVMHTNGFRYFIAHAASPYTEVNSTYVRQNRLMVTGRNMQKAGEMFSGLFDPNLVLDTAIRGEIK